MSNTFFKKLFRLDRFIVWCYTVNNKLYQSEVIMKYLIINKDNFEEEVLRSNKPVLLDFYATWCGPCKMIAPIIEEIAEENDSIKVGKINTDEAPELARSFGIQYIPTLIVVRDGKETARNSGFMDKEKILALLEE